MTENIFRWDASDRFDYYDPENVAPTVAWLASDDAADVTGRVFIVGGGDVFLVQNFTPTNHLAGDRRWTVAELTANKAKLFEGETMGVPARATMPEA